MGNSDSRFTGKGNSDTRVSGLENFRSGHRKLVVRWKVWERRKLWECTLRGFNCSIYLPIYLSMDGNSRFTESTLEMVLKCIWKWRLATMLKCT